MKTICKIFNLLNIFIQVVPDKFTPIGDSIEIEGMTIGGTSADARYLFFDFSEYFGKDKDSEGFKEIMLYPGQYLGIAEGYVGYR